MNRNFDRSLSLVLKHEGGYVDHPKDPGGATNKGITIATFRRYVNAKGTKDDLRRLTTEQAGIVYRKQYWDKVRGDDLPDGVDYAVFDFAVNSGPSRAAKYLQDVLGVAQDGKIGPATLKAANAHRANQIIEELCADRLAFLQRLGTWKTFGRGWATRVAGVRSESLAMAARSPAPVAPPPAPDPAPAPVPQPPAQKPAPTPAPVAKKGLLAWVAAFIRKWLERK